MAKHTFASWLHREVASAKYALLELYEQSDKLQYIDGPQLEKEYMEQVGTYEETVIKEEIECEVLQKKQQMVQAAINRREPVDEAAIDAALEEHRQQLLKAAAGEEMSQEFASLSADKMENLQELYREIVKNFHPQMHPDLTEAHRRLFQKAQEAYRHRDLAALQLIHDMLFSMQEEGIVLEVMMELSLEQGEAEDAGVTEDDYLTDYALAGQIYGYFSPTAEEAAIQEERTRYRQMMEKVMADVEHIKMQFPFTAAEMLADPEKIAAYKESLAHRLRTATEEKERRTLEIRAMIESVSVHG